MYKYFYMHIALTRELKHYHTILYCYFNSMWLAQAVRRYFEACLL